MVGLSPLGNLTLTLDALQHKTGGIVGAFKTWKLTFTAELVTTNSLDGQNSAIVHEALAKALRDNAGYNNYLVANEETRLDQEEE